MGTREDMSKGFNMGCGFLLGAILLIIFAIAICLAVSRAKQAALLSPTLPSSPTAETKEIPSPEKKIKVLDFNWRNSSASYYRVEGRVQNISSEPISLVTIGIDFFNDGKWVGCDKEIDYLKNISPGEIRSFSTVASRPSSVPNSATLSAAEYN